MVINSQTFGDFIQVTKGQESLSMDFSFSSLSLRDYWLNNSLSADFLADYWGTFFPIHANPGHYNRKAIREMISYIVNELLDNALKYGHRASRTAFSIGVSLYQGPDILRIYVTNTIYSHSSVPFQEYIQTLLREDAETLYFRQMERNATEENHQVSRLGLLSILHDYQAQLAWKFDELAEEPEINVVTTMVQVPIGDAHNEARGIL